MILPRSIYLFAIVLSSPTSSFAEYFSNDFDKVCIYFTDMSKLANVKRMTYKQRYQYISKRIKKELDQKGNAVAAWKTIAHTKPEQRYERFMSSAQSSLRQPWSCNAMEIWVGKTGRNK